MRHSNVVVAENTTRRARKRYAKRIQNGTCKNINLNTNHCKQFTISLTALVSNTNRCLSPTKLRLRLRALHSASALDSKWASDGELCPTHSTGSPSFTLLVGFFRFLYAEYSQQIRRVRREVPGTSSNSGIDKLAKHTPARNWYHQVSLVDFLAARSRQPCLMTTSHQIYGTY